MLHWDMRAKLWQAARLRWWISLHGEVESNASAGANIRIEEVVKEPRPDRDPWSRRVGVKSVDKEMLAVKQSIVEFV